MKLPLICIVMFAAMQALPVLAAEVAPQITDPTAALKAIYDSWDKSKKIPGEGAFHPGHSARLTKLERTVQTPVDDVGCIDFDYFINGQDGAISDAKLRVVATPGPTKMVVEALFKNFGNAEVQRISSLGFGNQARGA